MGGYGTVIKLLIALLALASGWLVKTILKKILTSYNSREQKRLELIQRIGFLPSEEKDLTNRLMEKYLLYWYKQRLNWLGGELQPALLREIKRTAGLGLLVVFTGILLAIFKHKVSILIYWTGMGILLIHWPLIKKRRVYLRQRQQLQREMPNLIDGVRVLLGAGFSCAQTLSYWKRFAGPALLPYLQQLEQEADLEGLETALTRFGTRVNTAPAQVLVSLLLQEMRGGIDIRAAVGQLSGYQRKIRWQQLRGELKKKPVYLALLGAILFANLFILIGVPTVQLILRIRQLN
ncbi:hypothetical protein JDF658_24860 [Carboxydocella sp. JDF658]|nr:hypothetical protein JDF658_24860 [Carboxydocella sp. JDF658]